MPTFAVELEGRVYRCQVHPGRGSCCGKIIFNPPVPPAEQEEMLLSLADEGIFDTLSPARGEAVLQWEGRGRIVALRG